MNKVLSLVFVLLSLSSLHASDPLSKQPTCVIAEEAPCAFVNDTVNVVNGNFYLQMPHLAVPGHVPLDLVQYYNSQSTYSSWFGTGMGLNYSFASWVKLYSDKKNDTEYKYSHILAESPGGSIIRCLGKLKNNKSIDFFLDPEVIHNDFTNCGSGPISARSNLKNTRINHFLENFTYGYITCYLPDGAVRRYYSIWDNPTTYVFSEKRLNKTELAFDYHRYTEILRDRREIKRIKSIKKIKAKAKHDMNWLEFSQSDHHAKITSSNGKSAQFSGFEHEGNVYIDEITSSDNPKINFDYHKAGKYYSSKMAKRTLFRNRIRQQRKGRSSKSTCRKRQ